MRVIATALAICAVSFLAGLAGDLSTPGQPQVAAAAPVARVALPPHLENAVRARPLTATSTADAAPRRETAPRVEAQEKPVNREKRAPKVDRERAPKADAKA